MRAKAVGAIALIVVALMATTAAAPAAGDCT
jgi:hypothetical protein